MIVASRFLWVPAVLLIGVLSLGPDVADAQSDQKDKDDYQQIEAELKKVKQELSELTVASHKAIDMRLYDDVQKQLDRMKELSERATALQQKLDSEFLSYIDDLLPELDHEEYARRDAATKKLLALGPQSVGPLTRLRDSIDNVERKARINWVLERYGLLYDEDGRMVLWAEKATASSEYGNPQWSAMQAAGEPDTHSAGDIPTAWTTPNQNGGEEWLKLTYSMPIEIDQVVVHQTYNPGTIVAIDAVDELTGETKRVWEGKDPGGVAPVFVTFDVENITSKQITLHLDTSLISGWNEIDAVKIVGNPDSAVTFSPSK